MRTRARDKLATFLLAVSIFSLLMFAVSYLHKAHFSRNTSSHTTYFAGWQDGKLLFARQRPKAQPPSGYAFDYARWGVFTVNGPAARTSADYGPLVYGHYFAGLQWYWDVACLADIENTPHGPQGHRFEFEYITVGVPWWWITLLSGIYPSLWLRGRRLLRRRVMTNHCLTCGYDLRESPVRCPECGSPTETIQHAQRAAP